MTKHLLHPPETTHSFTLNGGCGKPHEYDGVHGIDCDPCVAHVASLSSDERVAMHLRGAAPAVGATPEEREVHARAHLAQRERASWRLLPAEPEADSGDDGTQELAAENEALKARIRELEDAAKAPTGGKRATSKA